MSDTDLAHILSTSPHRSFVSFTQYQTWGSEVPRITNETERRPIHEHVTIDRLVATWESYVEFHTALLRMYAYAVEHSPFTVAVDRLTLMHRVPGYPLGQRLDLEDIELETHWEVKCEFDRLSETACENGRDGKGTSAMHVSPLRNLNHA
ncbi:uncharacterized protein C8Q71DRAFT_773982 [Rhodofomes roseus]|uniref:Uncharacterized protein n=1 Tax=Rhodofomes roseus TaxID=34475 RepID=A0ABQ8K8J4_9APHY|nr:uncharacterized protein C8Q71DRAFT_773982 [Rhodofomes roseus]KAH9833554.1 hypothetical protein C8Q71DRAFT_773982 [Rhodofomes roseus]